MDSPKRRRVDDNNAAADRLGDLPDCILTDVLSRMGSRQAVQTSSLSRRWRHLWRDVRVAHIDDREFPEAVGRLWERFEDFADHMLPPSPPQTAPHLDAFRLHAVAEAGINLRYGGCQTLPDTWLRPCLHVSSIGDRCRYAVSDRWIRRGLRRSPAAVAIHASDSAVARWITPPQPSTLRRLATLRLVRVAVGAEDGFFERLGSLCPVLEELHVEDCRTDGSLRGIDSPTLIRLAVLAPRGRVSPADLICAAPRLAFLRLELPCMGLFGVHDTLDPPPLASVTEASIRITYARAGHEFDWELWANNKKLEFLSSMRGLLARLPNAATLHLSGFTPTALLDNASHEFPTLQNLRALLLDNCDVGASYHALTSILRNAPNLEKLRLHHCKFVELLPLPVLRSHGVTGALPCEKLESIEMKSSRTDDASRLLRELSKRMAPARWQRIRKSSMRSWNHYERSKEEEFLEANLSFKDYRNRRSLN